MKKVQIFFNAEHHRYTDDEGNVYTSATQLIGKYTPTFPKEFWAFYRAVDQEYGMFGKPRPDIPLRVFFKKSTIDEGKYYTIEELKTGIVPLTKSPGLINKEWDENAAQACERGNREHDYLENSVNAIYDKKTVDHTLSMRELPSFKLACKDVEALDKSALADTHPEVLKVLKNLISKGYTIFAEKRVYTYDHKVSGMIDVIAVNAKKEFVIVDWKTNKDPLIFESGYYEKVWNADRTEKVKTDNWIKKDDRMYAPIQDLQKCKGTIYTLQLSLYARICELWGLKCKGLILCHLRIEMKGTEEFHHKPKFYNITYMPDHIDRLLNKQPKQKPILKRPRRKPLNY